MSIMFEFYLEFNVSKELLADNQSIEEEVDTLNERMKLDNYR